jgi:NlpC/P60 family putative phage cell wall peptidase
MNIHISQTTKIPAIETRVVDESRKWLGTPYRHQGSRLGVGADCLGLVRGVWRALYGIEPDEPGPYSMDWAEKGGEDRLLEAAINYFEMTDQNIESGRLVLFRWNAAALAKHAVIMVSNTSFIHAYSGVGVVESPLVPSWRKKIAGVFAFPKTTTA